ncbi:Type II secretion system protein GspN [Burkholderiales bacterium]
MLAPASLLSQWVSQSSSGVIRLASPAGTLWSGSAQLQFHPERLGGDEEAKPHAPLALPGRLQWSAGWSWSEGIRLQVSSPQISGSLGAEPIRLSGFLGPRPQFWVPDGSLQLPTMNLRHATGPLALVRPEFKASAQWSGLRSTSLQDFRVTITLADLGSAISPIRPLGSYRVVLAPESAALRAWIWRLESLGEPVIQLDGQGRVDQMLRGRLTLQCMRSCEFVGGILSAVGKKNGEVYEAQFGL